MNRIIGILFSVIALAAILFAAMNYGNYRSLCFTTENAEEDIAIETSADSLATPDIEIIDPEIFENDITEDPLQGAQTDSTAMAEEIL